LLDLGCGEGRHCINAAIAHTDIQVVGVDLSHKNLTVARSRLNDFDTEFGSTARQNPMTLCLANGLQLPFNDNSFDHIICSEVLEHIPDYHAVLTEIERVLKPGGVFAASVPRFFPEWVCWQLSDEYHEVEGGHVRIFNANHLRQDIERNGFVWFKRHWAHSLHVPYWWLKCLFWRTDDQNEAAIVTGYHKFLVWDLMKQPWITRTLEKLLNPLLGKSVVMYFIKKSEVNRKDTNQQSAQEAA